MKLPVDTISQVLARSRPSEGPTSSMILCVTLNPCLDKTLSVAPWSPGDTVRGHSVREVVGGKGNNVARALGRLGRADVRPVTFLGGAVGRRCEELMRSEDGFDPIIVPTGAATREILTVRSDGTDDQTAFFDPDPAVSEGEADALVGAVRDSLRRGGVEALTLSGSSPSPSTHGVYSELIAIAAAAGTPTFLDTYGPSLRAIGGFWPRVATLNLREAAAHLGITGRRPDDEEVASMLGAWSRSGVELAAVTDGPSRFLAWAGGRLVRVAPPAIRPVNPIGSGDCLLAGLVDATLSGLGAEDRLRHAVGCAAANAMVWDAGGLDPDEARRLADEVEVVDHA